MNYQNLISEFIKEQPFSIIPQHLIKSFDLYETQKNSIRLWNNIKAHALSHGLIGLTLRNQDQSLFCIITGDAGVERHFRYTTFDERGFRGHGTYESAIKAVRAAFDMGLRYVESRSKLDSVMRNLDTEEKGINIIVFDSDEKAFVFRHQNGGWLFKSEDQYFWFSTRFKPSTIFSHPILRGLSGELL